MIKGKKSALFSATSPFFRVRQILSEDHHEMEWGVMTGVPAEELCEINYMTRDIKNKNKSDMAV